MPDTRQEKAPGKDLSMSIIVITMYVYCGGTQKLQSVSRFWSVHCTNTNEETVCNFHNPPSSPFQVLDISLLPTTPPATKSYPNANPRLLKPDKTFSQTPVKQGGSFPLYPADMDLMFYIKAAYKLYTLTGHICYLPVPLTVRSGGC